MAAKVIKEMADDFIARKKFDGSDKTAETNLHRYVTSQHGMSTNVVIDFYTVAEMLSKLAEDCIAVTNEFDSTILMLKMLVVKESLTSKDITVSRVTVRMIDTVLQEQVDKKKLKEDNISEYKRCLLMEFGFLKEKCPKCNLPLLSTGKCPNQLCGYIG